MLTIDKYTLTYAQVNYIYRFLYDKNSRVRKLIDAKVDWLELSTTTRNRIISIYERMILCQKHPINENFIQQ